MNQLKRWLGIVWMALAPVLFFLLLKSAAAHISASGKGDISRPLPWIIIIAIFIPVATGLVIFGWYAFNGEYDDARRID